MFLPNLKEKQINIFLFFLLFLLLVINLVFVLLWVSLKKKQNSIQNKSITKQAEKNDSLEKDMQVLSSADYIVKSIRTNTQVNLQGNSGETTILNNSKLHVFFAGPNGGTPTSFSDLTVGQKVTIKTLQGKDDVWIYISR